MLTENGVKVPIVFVFAGANGAVLDNYPNAARKDRSCARR